MQGNPISTIRTDEASSSTLSTPVLQHSFMLGRKPFPATVSLRMFRRDDSGRVADSLKKAIMLPEDVRFWEDATDEDVVLNLKWNTIVVSFLL